MIVKPFSPHAERRSSRTETSLRDGPGSPSPMMDAWRIRFLDSLWHAPVAQPRQKKNPHKESLVWFAAVAQRRTCSVFQMKIATSYKYFRLILTSLDKVNSALCGFHPSFSSLSRACRNSRLSILALETQIRVFETFWLQHMWKFAKLVTSSSGYVLPTELIHAREETKWDLLLVQLQPFSWTFFVQDC